MSSVEYGWKSLSVGDYGAEHSFVHSIGVSCTIYPCFQRFFRMFTEWDDVSVTDSPFFRLKSLLKTNSTCNESRLDGTFSTLLLGERVFPLYAKPLRTEFHTRTPDIETWARYAPSLVRTNAAFASASIRSQFRTLWDIFDQDLLKHSISEYHSSSRATEKF